MLNGPSYHILPYLSDGDEMGELMRAFDWAHSPLGTPGTWPPSLKTLVGVMLGSHQAMFIAWGPQRLMLYNDAYAQILGEKHPAALAQPVEHIWPEIWDDIEPIMSRAYKGESTHMDDITLMVQRRGYAEETHFSFSYTPVRSDAGEVAGMFCACTEITETVLAKRALQASEARATSILESITDGFFAVDNDWRFTYLNPQAGRILDIEPEDFIGKTLWESYPGLIGSEFERIYRQAKKEQVSSTFTLYYPDHDRWYEVHVYPSLQGLSVYFRNATDRIQADEALKESEARFKDIAESMPQLVWIDRGSDGWCEYLSSQWAEYTGQPTAELLGFEWLKLLHPDDQDRTAKAWEEAVAGRSDYNIEYRIRRHDGEYRWFKVRGVPILDENGAINVWYGTCTDIHEQKETEQELRQVQEELERRVEMRTSELQQQQDFLKTILENISDGIVACNADGVLSLFNRATKQLHGLPERPLPAEQWSEHYNLYNADGLTPMKTDDVPLFRALHDGHVKDAEMVVAPREGEARYLLANGQALYDEKGKKLGAVVSMHDITDRKHREEDLAKSRMFLRQVIDTVADPIFVKDRNHRWIEGNHAMWSLIGKPEQELLGKSDYDVFPKEQADAFWAGDDRVFNGESFITEEVIRTADGNDRIISTKKVPFTLMDGQQGLVGVIRDVTEQRVFEEELRQHRDHLQEMVELQTRDLREAKELAEHANIAKSEFLANMSHEIRTPMNAVIGLSHILAVSSPLTPKQKEFIQTLQLSADSLLSLINDLLDIAKIEARSVELEEIPFSFAQLMQEITSIMSVRAKEKALEFTYEGSIIENTVFTGDPARIRQVIINLCSNALKFTEKGGVYLSVSSSPKDGEPQKQMVCLTVRDTGIGIAGDKLETIFQKFVQADSSINRKYGGTGLGLAITKTLTEIMNGTIEAKSDTDSGSVFTVCLPLTVADENALETSDELINGTIPSDVNVERPRVLLVEDYPPNVLVATTFLEQFGYSHDVASNGMEAVEKAKAGQYVAILMDVQMHGMNGFDATQLIRAHEREAGKVRLPIIGMTAHALAGDRERCIAAGMNDYIAKPFSPKELQSLLETLVALNIS